VLPKIFTHMSGFVPRETMLTSTERKASSSRCRYVFISCLRLSSICPHLLDHCHPLRHVSEKRSLLQDQKGYRRATAAVSQRRRSLIHRYRRIICCLLCIHNRYYYESSLCTTLPLSPLSAITGHHPKRYDLAPQRRVSGLRYSSRPCVAI
jgi:hypothetical protein